MRVFISVDMEGISGLEKIEECFLGMPAYDKGRQIMAGDVNAARDLIGVGDSPFDAALPIAESAAWTMLASQLMNLDEVLNK